MILFLYIVGHAALLGLVFTVGWLFGANMIKNDIHFQMRACDHDFDLDENGVGICRKCGYLEIVH